MADNLGDVGLNDTTLGGVADTVTPTPPTQGTSRSNFLTRTYGALPVWGWGLVLIGGAVVGLIVLPRFFRGNAINTASTDTSSDMSSDSTLLDGAALARQFAISTGPAGATGPVGATGLTGTTGAVGPAGPATPAKSATPATPAKTAAPAAKGQWIIVKPWPGPDSTLSGIAQHYYGNASKWPTIYNANKATIGPNPNLIQDGAKLWVPAL